MTFPISFGWPQILLILIAIIGLGMLITSVTEVRRKYSVEYVNSRGETVHRYRRGRLRTGRGSGGLAMILLALSLLWLGALTQTYLGLTADRRVAQVRAVPISNRPIDQPAMSIELILFDKDGKQLSLDTYTLEGDLWMLQGNIVKFHDWLGIAGLQSGYKLTRLQGMYSDPQLERTKQHTVIELNGGDDNFFKWVRSQRWTGPLVDAAYGNAVFLPPDRRTYDVLISRTGLFARPI